MATMTTNATTILNKIKRQHCEKLLISEFEEKKNRSKKNQQIETKMCLLNDCLNMQNGPKVRLLIFVYVYEMYYRFSISRCKAIYLIRFCNDSASLHTTLISGQIFYAINKCPNAYSNISSRVEFAFAHR